MDESQSTAVAEPPVDSSLLEKLLNNRLSEEEARRFASENPECITFTLLALQQRLAGAMQTTGSNTPSSVIPPFQKPPTIPKPSKQGKKKRGGQPGHVGRTRDPLPQPDRTREHHCERCPDCNGELTRTGKTRSRRSEDIPEDLKPVITEDVIHRDYCPNCQKRVEPKLPDVLPNCTLGNRTLVLATLLYFLQGLSIGQIVDTFNFHLRMKVTPGGLVQMWHRLADLLFAWYDQIHQESLESATLHADETGWRVSGKTHWLWCFANSENVFYMIDRSRGSPALTKFFTLAFEGTLITDFWSPYEGVICADKQKCWPHLLRDLAAVDEAFADHKEWKSFSRRLVGVYRDAKKLHPQRAQMTAAAYDMSVARLEARLGSLANESWEHSDANRLAKRLSKYGHELLTFLWHNDVPSDNNAGERAIRPAVMIRKNSYCNHSDRGALTQSVLMSVLRTLRVRGNQPLDTIMSALAAYSKTGILPPLPAKALTTG
jgi:transposase